ncbi:hypothetical protein TPHA_0C00210 [Tetrapisispora phaffii CBS 4417]|uniref:Uncharacterized protein n=1 Tax=Tetrapisispora phaffii (strain ATCC 24235 / CBS 4417 / NBRC 1672 / NRRL Y-8282 / UCD 70-5) TaxID=1071381 RepID=G8BR02_TETPH|nr:hypothetical protein TPHA_0C00210 [Tetrapisispora phaffii CBS 4417]CCE62178.1 hypothetical protein TPHA_0C00210 [Tetrapisispora phaffii CBS 4417]
MNGSYHNKTTMTTSNSTNFVNAPFEYSERARDTIKKKLLFSQKNTNASNRKKSKILSRTCSDDVASAYSAISNQSSIFSNPLTVTTTSSHFSSSSVPTEKIVTTITLEDALPKTFYDMYTPEILMSNPLNLFHNGRPKFTKRELMDWDLNDIRSLLIIDNLKPEWGDNLPSITLPNNQPNASNINFRFQLLPLNSSDEFIIETLVTSDLYKEANLDYEFRFTSARYTVALARRRHEQMLLQQGVPPNQINKKELHLSKPEWRNIIENFLLNIAVETQCRADFKQQCSQFKKWKQEHHQQQMQNFSNLKKPHMPPPSGLPLYTIVEEDNSDENMSSSKGRSSSSLLRKTLMKNLQSKTLKTSFNKNNTSSSNNTNTCNNNNNNIPDTHNINNLNLNNKLGKITLAKEEKADIWAHCQSEVYQRLGLDWKPDRMSIG